MVRGSEVWGWICFVDELVARAKTTPACARTRAQGAMPSLEHARTNTRTHAHMYA